MRDTRRAAEYLFDEIGGIDDSYIAHAQSAGVRRVGYPRRIAIIAAAAALAVVMVAALPMSFISFDKEEVANDRYDDTAQGDAPSANAPVPSAPDKEDVMDVIGAFELDSVLGIADDSLVIGEAPDLFDGTPRLLWQSEGGQLCGVTLSAAELEHLGREQGRGEQVGDAGLEAEFQVWISYGNGLVISPYLEDSPGNVGYGELFDYSPEIIPSSAVTGRIRTIIERNV